MGRDCCRSLALQARTSCPAGAPPARCSPRAGLGPDDDGATLVVRAQELNGSLRYRAVDLDADDPDRGHVETGGIGRLESVPDEIGSASPRGAGHANRAV